MTLSEELTWRGFVHQTTYKDATVLDSGESITFYLGVDPSASSMTIGNLATVLMVRHFVRYGHKAILLVGGATGLIGDPDGKVQERQLKTEDQIAKYALSISAQFQNLLAGHDFTLVDNNDWFKGISYLDFLRTVGKNVPMRQMLGREFVQKRLGEDGAGISYAEFSYALIQAYDFLHLHQNYGANLQISGADQWGNSIAGVDLIRRVTGDEVHVWTAPLIINKASGIKFGKTEAGAVWLDPELTSPTEFYQFWVNLDDTGVEDYLKIYTMLTLDEVNACLKQHAQNPAQRHAQTVLARAITEIVHGAAAAARAEEVTQFLTEKKPIGEAEAVIEDIRSNIPCASSAASGSIIQALVATNLAESNSQGRRLLQENAIAINGQKVDREQFIAEDFQNGRLLIRRGKAFKDSALIELQ